MSTNHHPISDQFPANELLSLTTREWEVLLHIANDPTNAEIAERLCVTTKSVENYRTRINYKLGIKGHRVLSRYVRRHETQLRQWYQLIKGKLPPPELSDIFVRRTGINVTIGKLLRVFTSITEGFSLFRHVR